MRAAADELVELDDVNREAGRVVLAASRPPRLSGALAAGQRVVTAGDGVQLVSSVRYWTFVHFGAPRAGTRAQPWIADALTRSVDDVLDVYRQHTIRSLQTATT